jgi:PAS domain S-box-containing protein
MPNMIQNNEISYQHLLDTLILGVVYQDADGKIIFANPAAEKVLGLTLDQMTGRTSMDPRWKAIHEDGSNYTGESHPAMVALKTGKSVKDVIMGVFNPELDTYRWININAVPEFKPGESKPFQVYTIFEDITERKTAEAEMIQEHDFISKVLAWIDSLVVVVDLQGYIVVFNRASEKLSGYQFSEVQDKPFWDILLIPEEREAVKQTIKDVIHKGIAKNFTNFWVTKSGQKRMISWKNSVLTNADGVIEYILCTGLDITEAHIIEEALRESESKYRELVQNANSMIIRMNAEGRLTFFNEYAEKFFGYTEAEILGKSSVGTIIPEIDSSGKNQSRLVADIFKHPGRHTAYENENMLRSGERVWVAWTNKAIKNDEGEVTEILCIGNDITERRRAEKAMRESEEKLARSRKMESLGLLAGGIAHDLNNVLSGIVSYPELMLMDLPEDSNLRTPIEAIQESGHRATAIVQDLLTVARGVATPKEPLNINEHIMDYLGSPEYKKLKQFHPNVIVRTDLDTELLNISGSPVHIRKVMMNLVSNAIEAIDGDGNVVIRTRNRYLDRPLNGYDEVTIGEYVILSVSDTGSGISVQDLERIFEPFYSKKFLGRSGTGLGLAVVWNTVQDHKGYIDVKNAAQGTTFDLYFPITRDEIHPIDLTIPFEDLQGQGEKVLVVDDVESQRDISSKMLETLGYDCEAFSSGEEAIEYLKENKADLIVLDMIMDPGINGRETYERVIKIHPTQKAIIVSGFAETEEVTKTQQLGAGKYIKKPLTLEKIGVAVKEELMKPIN